MLSALAIAAAGLLAALVLGASLLPAVLALFAGALAVAIVLRKSEAANIGPSSAEEPRQTIEAAPVLDAIEEPLLLIRERRVVLANAAARAVLGQHIAGSDIRLAIRHPAAAEKLADVQGGDGRTELLGLGGSDRRWEMAVAGLTDGSRLVRLTDRSEIQAAEQMRTDFIANASHELRTPLATVIGFLETLIEDEDAPVPTRKRFLGIMFDEARRMRQIVDDLISLSRIEAERFSIPDAPVDLLQIISEVRSTLENVVAERGAGILTEIATAVAIVPGDRAQLHQLFSNLVANALKYGREGGTVKVRLATSGPEMLRIDVIDEGEGIPPEHLPRLTERFYRVDAGRSRSVGGTGLGLAIVKHIVSRHRGRLEISSTVGVGTTVSVYLPRRQDTVS